MSPRRLLPYLVIFLIFCGAYVGLRWHQAQQTTQKAEAAKVFHLSQPAITSLSLIRGRDTVSLTKKNKIWYVTAPISTKADQTIVDNMLTSLARLRKERDLGVEKDLQAFGLVHPPLVVKFTAKGKASQLAIGAQAPGGENYYVLADKDPHVLLISRGSKDSLDRSLLALRDKTLFTFVSDEVKGLKVVTPKQTVNLEKLGPQHWRWVGKPNFKVRGDKVSKLVRDLQLAQAKNFIEPVPKKLQPLGLVPKRQTEITVITSKGDHSLLLGAKKGKAVYARKATGGAVMLVAASLPAEITKTLGSLADHRLWSGAILQVRQVVWGPPGHTWTATKEKENWQITGPDQATIKQPSVRLEMALWDFQQLEALKTLPQAKAPKSLGYSLELRDKASKPLFRLDAVGPQGKHKLRVSTSQGGKTVTALIAQGPFKQWQGEMGRLVADAKKPAPPPKQGATPTKKPQKRKITFEDSPDQR
jgi:hypothetical protein